MIRLGARRADARSAEISVRDSGVGIQPRDLPHVFTRFYRGSPFKPDGTLLRVPGMGQGLFISQRVIEAHGGTLHLDSQPGRGTQVVCSLPLTAPVTMSFESTSAAIQAASLQTMTDVISKREAASLARHATPPGRTPPRR